MHKKWQMALARLHEKQHQHLDLQIRIAEIPAPYHQEEARAVFMAQAFEAHKLQVSTDAAGNIRALRAGCSDKLIIVAAHMDAAFPESTRFKVTRVEDKLLGPSIVDNSLGLMAMLALIESLNDTNITTQCSLLFIATVGEEGDGDLRGVKALMSDKQLLNKTKGFIALDSQGHENIGCVALGSKRYKVTVKGPGGHSYLNFGTPNPLSAVAKIINNIDSISVSEKPVTTFNVGVVSGGVSANVIPASAELDIDMRSTDREQLATLEKSVRQAIESGVNQVNRFIDNKYPSLNYQITQTGDRPCGHTPKDSALITAVTRAANALNLKTFYQTGSSDANVPMSLGIPAVKLGAGGQGGGLHSVDEWYCPTDAYLGRQRALLALLTFDQT